VEFPYSYDRTHQIGELRDLYGDLEPGAETGRTVRVAGRIRSVRGHGKAAFADLQDETGRVQLFARENVIGDEGMAGFKRINVGDIVGAEGTVLMTRRGELSIGVASGVVLAPCQRPMPEKWHGMTDVEARHRQRYLDLIVNPEARVPVYARARANAAIRTFMEERGFLEVETPLLHPIAGGAVARPFVTHHNALDIDLYLRIAPELYLKRLLIGGFERVYEINRSFRNEGVGSKYNPEFTMLEAYEAFVDYHHTMVLVEDLVRVIAEVTAGSLEVESSGHKIDFAAPFERITMFEAIRRAGGPGLEEAWRAGDEDALRGAAAECGVELDPSWGPGKLMLEIFEARGEKGLIQPTYVTGFPKEVSPLAKDHRDIPGFTEHADLVVGGTEIAPVYSELNDPAEQKRRFEQQARARAAGDEEATVPDEDFLDALAYGMPPAGGFGLGLDRLLTISLGLHSLREVILFPTLKPNQ
jgi:lysyl-tRNA synthetase, class II